MNLSAKLASWLISKADPAVVAKAGNWQQLFNRGVLPEDGAGAQLSKPYANSAWVLRAIKHVTEPLASMPLKWELSEREFTDARLAEFWAAPVINLKTFADFVEAWAGWIKLKGEAFLIADDAWLLKVPGTVAPSKFILPPPSAMRHIVSNGKLVAWEYRDAAGNTHPLEVEQVHHVKTWNPYDLWRGLGEMEAAQLAAETDYLSGKYEGQLARNSGDQGLVVSTDGGQPTKEQIDQITAQLTRKRNRLQQGKFTDLFLAGGIKVHTPAVTSADTNFQGSRLTKRDEIFIAFGVPPSLAAVKQSYSLGKDSDYRALIVNTVMPVGRKLAGLLTEIGRLQTGQLVEAYLDADEHPVMQEVRRERISAARSLWDMGVPLKDASDYLDMALPRVPGDDVGYLPFSVAPVGAPEPGNDSTFDEGGDEGGDDDAVTAMLRALKSRLIPHPSSLIPHQCCLDLSDATLKAADPHWSKRMLQRRGTIKAFESRIGRVLAEARRETLAKLESSQQSAVSGQPKARAGVAADFVFDLAAFADNFFKGMRAISATAVNDAGNTIWQELGKDDPWKAAPTSVTGFVDRRANRLKDIPQDIWDQIRDAIQQGFDEGLSTDKIAANIRAEFNGIDRERAKTIAITETAAAYGFGEFESMKDAGITRRQWLSSGLPNVRQTHLIADGQVRRIDEPFTVGSARLMYPGDETGPAEEVINCHCVTVALPGETV
jgi:phage portal protein BeeE